MRAVGMLMLLLGVAALVLQILASFTGIQETMFGREAGLSTGPTGTAVILVIGGLVLLGMERRATR